MSGRRHRDKPRRPCPYSSGDSIRGCLEGKSLPRNQDMATQDDFTLDDFRKQLDQIRKMGPMKNLRGSMPGMSEMVPEGEDPDEQLQRICRMIDAMSEQERREPDSIDL